MANIQYLNGQQRYIDVWPHEGEHEACDGLHYTRDALQSLRVKQHTLLHQDARQLQPHTQQ